MKLPDVNLLLYASNDAAPQHERARDWWKEAVSGTETVALAWVVLLALEHGTTLYSADSDLARFPGLRWVDPVHP